MIGTITASFETLYEQSSMIADGHLSKAVKCIDSELGNGFAKKNPALVGAFMQAAVLELGFSTLAQQVRAGLETIAENSASALGEPLSVIADALEAGLCGNAIHTSISEAIHMVAETLAQE